ncbi:N-acetylneuraminate synthase family protein [Deltaproteobacteria bacterium TL4]
MHIENIDLDQQVLIIAEIGNNHEGSYSLAEELIGLAAQAGAHAVKFQTFKTEYYIGSENKDRFQRLKQFELSQEAFLKLSQVAQKEGILFLSTPLDLESAVFLKDLVAAYKIASGDNNFYPLIDLVAHTGKPIIVSGGASTLKELAYTKAMIDTIWQANQIEHELAILHCVSSYPVPADQANLSAITTLKHELKCVIGYSDHTIGIEASQYAVALGARIIEKHFTINKNYSDFRDHQLSADPKDLKALVDQIKRICQYMGNGLKVEQACEAPIKPVIRRSVAAKYDLEAGHFLRWEDLAWVRPADGYAPGEESKVLGRVLTQPLKQGQRITPDVLD